jgi:hypothetical protein
VQHCLVGSEMCIRDSCGILLRVEVLKAVKSRSNLIVDNPLEMMCGINLWGFSQMEM